MILALFPRGDPELFLYTRRSQNEQHDPHLLDNHRALLFRTAAADGVTVPGANSVTEIGTGERIASRPRFQALLARWEALPPDRGGLVYVTELSRLSRGLPSDQGRVMDALIRADLRVRTPGRIYDLRQFEDRFQFMALALVANAELELIKQRFANGKRELLLQGRLRNGRVPWGYRWNPLTGEPEASDAFPLLSRCCREVLTASLTTLATTYAVPRLVLYKALKNPLICGWPAARYRITRVLDAGGRPMTRLLPRDQWLWPNAASDRYPAACTRAEWEAIQVVLYERFSRAHKPPPADGWCAAVVRFYDGAVVQPEDEPARCGAYQGRGRHCLTYEWQPPAGPKRYIERAPVNAAAAQAIRDRLSGGILPQFGAPARPPSDSGALLAARARHEGKLVELLERELGASPIQARALRRLQEKVEAEIAAVERALQAAAREAPPLVALDRLPPLDPAHWDATWEALPPAEKRVVVRLFVREVPVVIDRERPVGQGGRLTRTVGEPVFWQTAG